VSENLQNKDFKISICFFCLQENPVLLVPWMLYTVVSLVANTVFFIVFAVIYIATAVLIAVGVGFIIGALINVCK